MPARTLKRVRFAYGLLDVGKGQAAGATTILGVLGLPFGEAGAESMLARLLSVLSRRSPFPRDSVF